MEAFVGAVMLEVALVFAAVAVMTAVCAFEGWSR
jgi:hypothetical protein